jgi:KGK domain
MNLDRNNVVSLLDQKKKVTSGKTFTIIEFANTIGGLIQKTNNYSQEWSTEGVECCVLQPGAEGWVKGKVRISLEFIPEEDEDEEEEEIEEVEVQDIKVDQGLLTASPLDNLHQEFTDSEFG